MAHTNKTKQKGFTLVETLTAIFILLIVTTGPLTAAQGGLRASFFARDQVIAFYLAQDAIETIKNTRDNLALDNYKTNNPDLPWLNNLYDCKPSAVGSAKKCTIDTSDSSISFAECAPNCPQLKIDNEGEYTYDTNGDPTRFTRTVYVTELVQDQEAQIIVEVKWDSNFFGPREVVVQENIYNWPPYLLNLNQ